MHVKKNICDNVLGTLLNIDGKTKDTEKKREDLWDLNIRKELHLQKRGNATIKPEACYNLSPLEKKDFLEYLKHVKFPEEYAANISRCVKEGKISGLKTHDCHILLQRLIPVGICGFLQKDVEALCELGEFFSILCSKTLKIVDREKMERNIPLILCKLETIFLPAFFDVMVHWAIHLPQEAKIVGPVHSHWMYPIERFLKTLKGFVRNKARPEGSIAEAYIVNECMTFMSMYLHDEVGYNIDGPLHHKNCGVSVFEQDVWPFSPNKRAAMLSIAQLCASHNFILNNSDEVDVFKGKRLKELKRLRTHHIEKIHDEQFSSWFRDHINYLHHKHPDQASEALWDLANGPQSYLTKSYSGCFVNGVHFHSKGREENRNTQNSGLVVEGDYKGQMIDFYGFVTNVIELTFLHEHKVVLFQCEWYNTGSTTYIRKDKHFVSLDVRQRWYKNDPFVLPNQVQQVFYLPETKFGDNWRIVQRVHHRYFWELQEIEESGEDDTFEDDVGVHSDAFQQHDSNRAVNVDDDDIGITYLAREDIEPDIVTEEMLIRLGQPDLDDPGEGLDVEDDTLT